MQRIAMTRQADRPRAAHTEFSGRTAEIELCGDLDDLTVPALSAEVNRLLDKRPGRLIFDLRAVTFLDAVAIRTLAGAALALPARTRPVIRGPSAVVRSLLELSSFNAAFEFEE
jgi:anti-anti-sigma factor